MKLIFFAILLSMPLLAMDFNLDLQTNNESTIDAANKERSLLAERYPLPVQYFTQRCKRAEDGIEPFPETTIQLIKKYLISKHISALAPISKSFAYVDNSLISSPVWRQSASKLNIGYSTFSPDEKYIITYEENAKHLFVKNLSLPVGESVKAIGRGNLDDAQYLFSADGKKLFIASARSLDMLDLSDWENIKLIPIGDSMHDVKRDSNSRKHYSNFMAINRNGTKLLVCSMRTIIFYDLTDMQCIKKTVLIEHNNSYAVAVHFSHDERAVLAGFGDGTLMYYFLNEAATTMKIESTWERKWKTIEELLPRSHDQGIVLLPSLCGFGVMCGFSPDGKWAVAIQHNGHAFFLNIDCFLSNESTYLQEFSVHGNCCIMKFNADSTLFFVGYLAGTEIYSLTHPLKRWQFPMKTCNVAFHPCAPFAVTENNELESEPHIWNLSDLDKISPTVIKGIKKLTDDFHSSNLSFNRDGSCIIIASVWGVILWPITQIIEQLSFEQIKAIMDVTDNADNLLDPACAYSIKGIPCKFLRKAVMRAAGEQTDSSDNHEKSLNIYQKHA